jgi:hypothetical protein
MAMTPEARVKQMVKKVLDEFKYDWETLDILDKASRNGYLYSHWPVMNGMGQPTLDCVVCYYGQFIAIETKAPGKAPTPRQQLTMAQMESAGAAVLVISDKEGCEQLRAALNLIKWSHASPSKPEA